MSRVPGNAIGRRRLGRLLLAGVPGLALPALAGPRAGLAAEPPLFRSHGRQFIFFSPLEKPGPTRFLTPSGDAVALARFTGRVVLLNYWATWCAPCVAEMPSLDRLQAAFDPTRLTVVAASIDRDGARLVKPFYERLGIENLEIYLDPDRRTVYLDANSRQDASFGIYALPITYLIDRRGRVVGYFPGPAEWDSAAARQFLESFAERP